NSARTSNPVVLSGDIHSFWVNDLKLDFDDPQSRTVATEFVGTSISARPPPHELLARALPDNPHVRYFESRRRGYLAITIEPARLTARLRAISDPADAGAGVATLQIFIVEGGRPGALPG